MSNVITIDGPSSTGKSTIGLLFAQKINYKFIDSGAFYRALCYYLSKNGQPIHEEINNANLLKSMQFSFVIENDKQKVYVNSQDVTKYLHSDPVKVIVPTVAAQKAVREAIKTKQLEAVKTKNTIMTGRNIGSEIFPKAFLKFYFDASIDKRAYRRYLELLKNNPSAQLNQVKSELTERDNKDTTRKVSPLKIPKGAIVIDTTNLTINQVLEKLCSYYKTHKHT